MELQVATVVQEEMVDGEGPEERVEILAKMAASPS
jgi:hypothetical protein